MPCTSLSLPPTISQFLHSFYCSVHQAVVCGGPQAVSEEKASQKKKISNTEQTKNAPIHVSAKNTLN
jgi:hypothetical protein